jgi:anti-sigma-K factor RskA
MPHPDPDLLADLALGEPVADDTRAHVAACEQCRDEVAALTATAEDLAAPAPELVAPRPGLRAEVLAAALGDLASPTTPPADPAVPDDHPARPTDELAARRMTARSAAAGTSAPGSRRFGLTWLVGAAAAGVVLGGAGAAAVGALRPDQPQVTVVAQTDLDTLDTGARLGVADLVEHNGVTDLALHTDPMSAGSGYLEVWLINRDGERMVSLGVMEPGRTDQTFTVPAALVQEGYVVVDISREPFDTDARHSGDSLARGTLPV